jgi:hypothetical protein
MDLNALPKLKESKTKIKQTFCLSKDAYDAYVMAKQKGYDSTAYVTSLIEKALLELKANLDKQKS